MTDTTRPRAVARRPAWKGWGMSRDSSDPRPAAPVPGSVANPRRTRLVREALVARVEDVRTDR